MRRFRFSLRTLVCLALLCGSGVALWRNWEPWEITLRLPDGQISTSVDDSKVAQYRSDGTVEIWNVRTGKSIASFSVSAGDAESPEKRVSSAKLVCNGTRLLVQSSRDLKCWDLTSARVAWEREITEWPDVVYLSDRVDGIREKKEI